MVTAHGRSCVVSERQPLWNGRFVRGEKRKKRRETSKQVPGCTTRKRTSWKLFKKLLVPLVGSIIIPVESRYSKFFNKFIFKTFIWKFHFSFIKISTKKADNAIFCPIDEKVVKVFFQIFIQRFPFDAKSGRNNFSNNLIDGKVVFIILEI